MIGHSASTWLSALPVGVVALAVLLLPGWLAAWLVGLRGFATLAVAPLVSVTTVSVGGVVSAALGIGWRPATLLGWSLLTWLVAWLVGWALAGRITPFGRRRRPRRTGLSLLDEWGWPLLALAVAAVGLAVAALPAMGEPSSFPQQPDTVFHLSTVQWMADRHDISTLHAAGYASLSGSGLYPAAFHGVATSVVLVSAALGVSGATAVVACTMVALAIAAVVWPLGCLLLARSVLGPDPATTLATGVTATAFSAFPLWLMGYGVLWPNLLGYALLPAALACLVLGARPSRPTSDAVPDDGRRAELRRRAWAVLLVALPGIAVAHPNALVSLVVIGVLVVLDAVARTAWQWRRDRGRAALLLVVGAAAGLAVLGLGYALATQRMTSMRGSNPAGAEMPVRTAFEQAVLQSPRGAPPLYVLGAVVVVGALVLLWRGRGRRWVVAALVVTGALWVLVAGVDSATSRWLTWPWYNNPPRLAALIVLPGVLCAAAALAAPAHLLRWWSGRRRADEPPSQPTWVAGVATVLAVVVPAGFVIATAGYVDQHRAVLRPYFHPSVAASWASPGELAALRRLARQIPSDAVTAANPWNGATYLYLVSGRRLLIPSEKVGGAGDRALLAERLSDVGSDPAVCAAARRQQVRFVITGGRHAGGGDAFEDYPGIDAVPESDAFAQVAQVGPYTLWRLTSCAQ